MKKIVLMIVIILSLVFINTVVYGKAHAHAHTSHSTSHASSHSTSKSSSTTIKGAKTYAGKTYTTPKSFSGKYNSSNIKTGVVNSSPSYYKNYSSTNMFRPNFWTAMWAFNCMSGNTTEASEQDISRELEERGYSQEEIQEILKEGKEAEEAEKIEQDELIKGFLIILISVVTFVIIVLLIIHYLEQPKNIKG